MFRKSLPKVKYFFFISFLSLLLVEKTHCFVHSRSEGGSPLKWPTTRTSIRFNFDSSSNTFSDSASQTAIKNIMSDSISQWDDMGLLDVSHVLVNSTSRGRNDIYFDKTGILTGTNVLGVTQVVYENRTGHIVEADIILNDSIGLKVYENESFYLGNVLTHEIGHALGFGHSEVGSATMFYLATNGQFTVSSDEVAGAHTLYRNLSSAPALTGQVVGGDSLAPLFGVHVLVVDQGSGAVEATTITDENGNFLIRGLDTSKDYSIMTAPIRNPSVLPSYYFDIRNDYCVGRQDIQKSFWQGCGASDEGHPVKVNIDPGETLNVGRISVRCNIDTPVAYSLNRESGYNLDLSDYSNAFVGYLTLNDIKLSKTDIINIDLSTEVMPTVESGEQLYLEVSLSSQELYSMLKLQTKVVFSNYSEATFGATDVLTSDYTPKSDYTFRLGLQSGLSDDNNFEFQVTGKNFETITYGSSVLTGYINSSNVSSNLSDFFPDYSNLKESSFFYLFNARIVKRLTDGSYQNLSYVNESFEKYDNGYCADAPLSYRSFPNVIDSASQEGESTIVQEENGLASALGGCGTIGPPGNGPTGGMMMFTLSMLLGLALSALFGPKFRQN